MGVDLQILIDVKEWKQLLRNFLFVGDKKLDEKCDLFRWADDNLEAKKVKKRKQKKSIQVSTASTKHKRRVVKHLKSSGDDEK